MGHKKGDGSLGEQLICDAATIPNANCSDRGLDRDGSERLFSLDTTVIQLTQL